MEKNRRLIKNSRRIFAMLLLVCMALSLFAGCDFTKHDTCTDPNCTGCAYVAYAQEVQPIAYVDCPDCTGGGAFVQISNDCTACVGGEVTERVFKNCTTCSGTGVHTSQVECNVCDGSGEFTCSNCHGTGTYSLSGENYNCSSCGGDGERCNSAGSHAGSGKVDCGNCVNGTITTSRCSACDGDGGHYINQTHECTVTGCVDGTITTSTWVECDTCDGVGGWTEADPTPSPQPTTSPAPQVGCDDCDFTGEIDCPDCDGVGAITINEENYNCVTCGGDGLRCNAVGSHAGSGKIPCPSCCDVEYFEVSYKCVDNDGLGFDDYTATVKDGDILPGIIGWSSDMYYFSSDEAGATLISKSTKVTDDMIVYVHITDLPNATKECTVKYYLKNDGWWFFDSYDLVVSKLVLSGSEYPSVDDYIKSDNYYLSYDKAGKVPVGDSDKVTADKFVYIHLYETGSVKITYKELTLMGPNSGWGICDTETLNIGDELNPPIIQDIETGGYTYEFVGWVLDEPKVTLGTIGQTPGLHGSDKLIDIDNATATTKATLYAVYDSADDDDNTLDVVNAVDNVMNGNLTVFATIIVVVLALGVIATVIIYFKLLFK